MKKDMTEAKPKASDKDFATGKFVNFSKPEEKIRQAYERILHEDYGYPKEQMDIGVPIQMGSSRRFCDIAVYDSPKKRAIIGIVETKAPKKSDDGKGQLLSYMSAVSSCRWGVWTNGEKEEIAARSAVTNEVEFNPALSVPHCGEREAVIKRFSHLRPASNLKWIFRIINNSLYANTNLARTEKQGAEMVRLLFCKLTDEYHIRSKPNRPPLFQVGHGETDEEVRAKINKLWAQTKGSHIGSPIFADNERIEIDNYSLKLIISKLQGYSLLKTSRDAVGDAFEVFSERQFAGEKGQFFTPRAVVSMVIAMINPRPSGRIIDPACGSGGFLVSAFNHITAAIDSDDEKKRVAEHCLYGIDKEGDLAKICKAHMSIIGDGKSNIVTADSLKSPKEWNDDARSKLLKNGKLRHFDAVITNPPFGSTIKVQQDRVLCQYDLGHRWRKSKKGMWEKTSHIKHTPPQVLFIELCMRLLKPGGLLGIVLPDGLLGNPGDEYIRQWIERQAEILAVVDCPTATFMPHTGTKTSVLIMQKRLAEKADGEKAGSVFFAIAEHCGHTMRGKDIKRKDGKIREDFSIIAENYLHGGGTSKHLGFRKKIAPGGVLVPRYYDPRIQRAIRLLEKSGGAKMVSIAELQAQGALEVHGVSASASSENYDLHGEIRFIRTSDIAGHEIYEHTQKMVSEEIYQLHCDRQDLRLFDILFVKDGDNKIGETAILAAKEDLRVLVQTHFKKFRPLKINPFLLLWLLNEDIVKKQIRQRVFNQSTLSTIGDRIGELRLPMPTSKQRENSIARKMERIILTRRQLLAEMRGRL